MLMATAFLLLAEVPDAVDLLCRDVAGSLAALFQYHLQNEPASRKTSLNFYELLRLLIDEQGSTETLIQQLTSGQAAMTAEYDGGTRIMEQFLRAVAYDVPEPVNFQVPFFSHPYFEKFYDFVFYEVCRPKYLPKQQNHKLFYDNYFNFNDIQLRLEDNGIWTCETKRSNGLRGCPLITTKAHVIIAVEWYDNRCVTLTSSYLGVKAVKLKNL
ncbi:hypothetical protein T08_1267 [Trichinella sp. T8]|nr:hypothetical protein T08_1267 [Trichinella sp. T8]